MRSCGSRRYPVEPWRTVVSHSPGRRVREIGRFTIAAGRADHPRAGGMVLREDPTWKMTIVWRGQPGRSSGWWCDDRLEGGKRYRQSDLRAALRWLPAVLRVGSNAVIRGRGRCPRIIGPRKTCFACWHEHGEARIRKSNARGEFRLFSATRRAAFWDCCRASPIERRTFLRKDTPHQPGRARPGRADPASNRDSQYPGRFRSITEPVRTRSLIPSRP